MHLLLCVADHYEPQHGQASRAQALRRVETWVERYPQLFAELTDSDGRPPRHSFFYPLEMYDREEMDGITSLCRQGFGEVEVHLHHDADTADGMTTRLLDFKDMLATRHGHLSRHRGSNEIKYGFIHGNWALDNSHPHGKACGVNNELDVLRETGCYADFTMPSFPDGSQTRQINSIYYAVDDPDRPRSHDRGVRVGTAPQPNRSLMLIQGPLIARWNSRKWVVVPRMENGCIQGSQPPKIRRVDGWLNARVQVPSRPDWFFVKLHTHGGPEKNQKVLLGEAMVDFHRSLARRAEQNPKFHYHYVTAREMYNLARAAEAGFKGPVNEALDWELVPISRDSTQSSTATKPALNRNVAAAAGI